MENMDQEFDLRVDGGWSDWSECTKSCGWDGMMKRTCTEPAPSGGGKPCEGSSSKPCNRRRCLEKPVWSSWSACSRTCGYGVQYRTCLSDTLDGCEGEAQRACKNPTPCRKPRSATKHEPHPIPVENPGLPPPGVDNAYTAQPRLKVPGKIKINNSRENR